MDAGGGRRVFIRCDLGGTVGHGHGNGDGVSVHGGVRLAGVAGAAAAAARFAARAADDGGDDDGQEGGAADGAANDRGNPEDDYEPAVANAEAPKTMKYAS